MLKAVIFDMDGVIVHTNPHHQLAWRQYYEQHGRTLSDAEFVAHVAGRHNRAILGHLFPDQTVSVADFDRLSSEKEALFRDLYAPVMEAVAGLVPFLERLRAHGIRLGVATAAPVENLDFIVDALSLRPYFDVLLHEKMVTNPKPDPEVYCLAMSELGVLPTETVIFEDSMTGIRAARASGARVVGMATTHSLTELATVTDDAILDFTQMSWARLNPTN